MSGRPFTNTRRLLDLIGETYSFDDLDDFRPGILEVLNRAVPSSWASYNEVSSDPARTFALTMPVVPKELYDTFGRLAHQNPILAEIRRTGDGRPQRISDLMDRASFRRLELYREFYRPLGVESQIAFTLPARAPLVLGIALCRGEEDFDDDDAKLLALARPHLIQSYRNAELSSARAAALQALESGLETMGRHIVVLDPDGRIEFATDTARQLLGDPSPGRDALPVEIRVWIAGRHHQQAASQPLALQIGGAALLVRLLPRKAADHRDVLLVEGGTGELTLPALRNLGLTERQAQTLRWVALGESAAAAAARMDIAPRTADKHLQNVYAKLGVSTLAEASATAWAAVGVHPED